MFRLCRLTEGKNPWVRISGAERLGFEPRVPVRVRRISSAVHSTTLASLLRFAVAKVQKNEELSVKNEELFC